MRPLDDAALILIETPEDVAEFATWLGERRPVLGVDTETGGLEWEDRLRLVQVGDAMTGWVIDAERWLGLAQWALSGYDRQMVIHNAAFDAHHLERNGCRIKRHLVDDTLVMAHLLDPPGVHGLKPLSVRHVDPRAAAGQEALQAGMRAQGWTWDTVPAEFPPYWLYSALDPVETARLWEVFQSQITGDHAGLYDLEMACLWTLVDAERRGIRVDAGYAEQYRDTLSQKASQLRSEAAERWKGPEGRPFNLGSSVHVLGVLEADGAPLTKRTKSGALSLDAEVLSGLAGRYDVARMMQEYKRAQKFRAAYVEATLTRLDSDGAVHPRIQSLAARTGRMSVSSPPLQQIPSHDRDTRRLFVPRDGKVLVSVDFSAIELRLLAHFAQDEVMLQAFRDDEDVHLTMARQMYGADAGKTERKQAKSGTFGKIYGIGPGTFAAQQGVSMDAARTFLDAYDETFPTVADFIQDVQRIGQQRQRQEGVAYVRTLGGRRPTLTPLEAQQRQHYRLVNYAIQGSAADIMKRAVADLAAAGLTDGKFLLPVHDECLFEVDTEDAAEFGAEVAAVMSSAATLSVPLTCDVEIYRDSWAESVPSE